METTGFGACHSSSILTVDGIVVVDHQPAMRVMVVSGDPGGPLGP